MVKLADALDSKSCGLIIRVGSSPTAGTNEKTTLQTTVRLFFHISAQEGMLAYRQVRIYVKNKHLSAIARLLVSARRRYKSTDLKYLFVLCYYKFKRSAYEKGCVYGRVSGGYDALR